MQTCMLTCRAFWIVAAPLMYRKVYLANGNLDRAPLLLNTLTANPALSTCVTSMCIDWNAAGQRVAARILDCCHNLRHLTLQDPAFLSFCQKPLPQLDHLKLKGFDPDGIEDGEMLEIPITEELHRLILQTPSVTLDNGTLRLKDSSRNHEWYREVPKGVVCKLTKLELFDTVIDYRALLSVWSTSVQTLTVRNQFDWNTKKDWRALLAPFFKQVTDLNVLETGDEPSISAHGFKGFQALISLSIDFTGMIPGWPNEVASISKLTFPGSLQRASFWFGRRDSAIGLLLASFCQDSCLPNIVAIPRIYRVSSRPLFTEDRETAPWAPKEYYVAKALVLGKLKARGLSMDRDPSEDAKQIWDEEPDGVHRFVGEWR